MVRLPDWLNVGGAIGAVDAIEEWVVPVAEAAKRWKDIGEGLRDIAVGAPLDSPARVLAYVLEHVDDEAVGDLFTGLGLGETFADIQALKSKFTASQFSKLLNSVSDLTEEYTTSAGDQRQIDHGSNKGLIEFPVSTQGAGSSASGKAGYEFSVKAGAKLEVEAGAVWPFRGDNVEPGLLRIGAAGELAAKGGASVPFKAGKATIKAGASFKPAFSYFYRPEPDSPFISALLPALRGLPDPFDLQSISNAAALGGFEGLVLAIHGAAEAGIEVALGKDLEIPKFVTGRAQLAAALSFGRESDWLLSLRANNGGFDIVLSSAKTSSRDWSVGAGLDLDMSGLAREINAALTQVIAFTGPWLKKIEPFLSPGTYVEEKLGSLLDKAVAALTNDAQLAEAIRSDAGILLSGEASGGLALEAWLTDQITGAIDDVQGGVQANAEDFVDKIFARLDAAIPELAANSIGTPAKAKVQELIDKLLGDFDALQSQILGNQNHAAAVVKELQAVGVKVKAASSKANQATEGIRELVAKYNAFLDDLVKYTKQAEKAKLSAQFSFSGGRTKREQYELIARVTKAVNPKTGQPEYSDGARALWRSLMVGDLKPFQRIMHDPALVPAGVTLRPESFLSNFASSSRGFAASVAIFDMKFEFEAVAKGEAEVREYQGRIVVSAQASASRRMDFLGTSRESNFISVYNLAASKQGQLSEQGLTLSIDLARRDENLSQQELKAFLSGLKDQRLISDSRIEDARDLLAQAGRGKPEKLPGDVTINLNLAKDALDNLIEIGRVVARDPAADRALFGAAIALLIDVGFKYPEPLQLCLAVLSERNRGRDALEALYDRRHLRGGAGDGSWDELNYSRRIRPVLEAAYNLSTGLATMFASIAGVYDEIPPSGEAANAEAYRKLREFYRKSEQRLANEAKAWIKLKAPFQTRMHPVMLALLRIMVSLHDRGDGAPGSSQVLADIARIAEPLGPGGGDPYIKIALQLGADKARHVV